MAMLDLPDGSTHCYANGASTNGSVLCVDVCWRVHGSSDKAPTVARIVDDLNATLRIGRPSNRWRYLSLGTCEVQHLVFDMPVARCLAPPDPSRQASRSIAASRIGYRLACPSNPRGLAWE
jgi:hypothetical protein